MVIEELDALKKQHKEAMKETQELRDRVGTSEGQLSRREAELETERIGRAQDLANLEKISKVADSAERYNCTERARTP